jgi:hypothetical protein
MGSTFYQAKVRIFRLVPAATWAMASFASARRVLTLARKTEHLDGILIHRLLNVGATRNVVSHLR